MSNTKLPIGTVLQLNGYDNPKYVIVKNLGINEQFASYGSRYLTVDLEEYTQLFHDSCSLKHIKEKTKGIQMYITDEKLSSDETLDIWEKSEAKRKRLETYQENLRIQREKDTVSGKELFKKHIPDNAKALIIAALEIDYCTDYFQTAPERDIIIGWSPHTRDLFSEMRKQASRLKETTHLATPPKLDSNGSERTEKNKSYWKPLDEHRENHAMGKGYYLKATGTYSTGWTIRKIVKCGVWKKSYYISMANNCIFEQQIQT